jgi:hypothetical protein
MKSIIQFFKSLLNSILKIFSSSSASLLPTDIPSSQVPNVPDPGWVGGFAESNPAFAYPNPDLSSLPMLDNLANIDKLQRQQPVKWPEFSWETIPGNPKSRCYQMFAPYISRLGYTNEGRVYSIICPQQGACSPKFGCMNVEVTVTGQRGWVNETSPQGLAADMTVVGKIWFSPSALQSTKVKLLWALFDSRGLQFPSDKSKAICVTTFKPNHPEQPIFPLSYGETKAFPIPEFARHENEAWGVGHLDVEIGPIKKTGQKLVDDFNALVMDVFNLASGNMLKAGNVLSWNVWFTAPCYVNQKEWATHAERWRRSIEADHGSPDGEGTTAKYFDGTPFKPLRSFIGEELEGLPKAVEAIKSHEEQEESLLADFMQKHGLSI